MKSTKPKSTTILTHIKYQLSSNEKLLKTKCFFYLARVDVIFSPDYFGNKSLEELGSGSFCGGNRTQLTFASPVLRLRLRLSSQKLHYYHIIT